jgi:hypothetical protein
MKKKIYFLAALLASVSIAGTVLAYASVKEPDDQIVNSFAERDEIIIKSFDVDLSGYTCLNPPDKAYFDENLHLVRTQTNIQPGDTVPVTYLSDDGSKAYIFKRDAYAINFMYEFTRGEDDWILISSDEKQGMYMPSEDPAESIKLRNSPEREQEVPSGWEY